MAKKYRHVLKAVFGSDWAILPEKLEQICELIDLRASGVVLSDEQIRGRIGLAEPPPNLSGSKIAVLNLFGTISQRMNMFSAFSGGTSTELFAKAFVEARDDDDVQAIVINADTPGGTVPGVPELSDLIYNSRDAKRIVTVVNPMMASAGVWIGSAASEVVAIPSASDIGSIGVVMVHTDASRAYENDGLRHTVIQSTEFKNELSQLKPLTESALAHAKKRVMDIHEEFVAAVARNRGVSVEKVEADFGRGRTFRARDALSIGLVDRIATLQEVLEELGASAGSNSTVAVMPQGSHAKDETMNPKIKLALIRQGLCKITDDDKTFQLALDLHCKANEIDASNEAAVLKSLEGEKATSTPESADSPERTSANEPKRDSVADLERRLKKARADLAASGAWAPRQCMSHDDLVSLVRMNIAPDRQGDLIAELGPKLAESSLSQILDRVNEAVREGTKIANGSSAGVTESEVDKFCASARDAILVREMPGRQPEQIYSYERDEYVDWKPDRRQAGLSSAIKLAEQCLVYSGVPYHRVAQLTRYQVAKLVMGADPRQMGLGGILASSDGIGYNVSGMFSNILLDAANVTLRRSYDDARTTFQQWMRQAPSIADFKTVNRVIAGELGDPKAIPEDGEFEETTLSDGKESYKLTVWGQVFSHSWQLIVNDQLSSFVEIPIKQGRAMRRKQNKLAYGVVNDNDNLADAVALFSAATHTNRQTGANADTTAIKAKWATMTEAMAEQTGLDSDSGALNLSPRFVIFPPAIADDIATVLNSTSIDATNPGIKNTMMGRYEPVMDAQMGAAQGGSDTRYVLAADPADIDTIEYAFLQGLEAPVLEQEVAFNALAMKRRIYQAFAVKAIDYRGLQDDTGA